MILTYLGLLRRVKREVRWRPKSRQAASPQLHTLALPDSGRLKVHGESQYQQALHAACAGRIAPFTHEDDCWDRALPVTVALRPEPSNAYDHNAVRVDVFDFGCVGYLPRRDAPLYQPILIDLESRGWEGTCPGWIVRNSEAGYYAIYLQVADPATVGFAAMACD
jgi:hypothetical protein